MPGRAEKKKTSSRQQITKNVHGMMWFKKKTNLVCGGNPPFHMAGRRLAYKRSRLCRRQGGQTIAKAELINRYMPVRGGKKIRTVVVVVVTQTPAQPTHDRSLSCRCRQTRVPYDTTPSCHARPPPRQHTPFAPHCQMASPVSFPGPCHPGYKGIIRTSRGRVIRGGFFSFSPGRGAAGRGMTATANPA